jgi:hypothetical protein
MAKSSRVYKCGVGLVGVVFQEGTNTVRIKMGILDNGNQMLFKAR